MKPIAAEAPPGSFTTTTLRVRYKDTDCMKVVYYGNYLTYFEVGRVEYLRQRGMPISEVDQRVHMDSPPERV